MSETTHVSSSNYTVILPSSAGAGVSVPVTFVDEYVPVGRPFVEYRNSNGEAVPVLDEGGEIIVWLAEANETALGMKFSKELGKWRLKGNGAVVGAIWNKDGVRTLSLEEVKQNLYTKIGGKPIDSVPALLKM